MTNEDFLRRFDAHEKFTEDEIKEMCWGEVGEVLKENIVGSGRRTINKKLIFRVGNRFFGIWWTEGATEEQDGCEEYSDYPTEVREGYMLDDKAYLLVFRIFREATARALQNQGL